MATRHGIFLRQRTGLAQVGAGSLRGQLCEGDRSARAPSVGGSAAHKTGGGETLDRCKIIGQRKISRQDLGGLASAMALDELYGVGFDYSDKDDARYEAVTLAQIKSAAQKYLRPDAFVVSVARPV